MSTDSLPVEICSIAGLCRYHCESIVISSKLKTGKPTSNQHMRVARWKIAAGLSAGLLYSH